MGKSYLLLILGFLIFEIALAKPIPCANEKEAQSIQRNVAAENTFLSAQKVLKESSLEDLKKMIGYLAGNVKNSALLAATLNEAVISKSFEVKESALGFLINEKSDLSKEQAYQVANYLLYAKNVNVPKKLEKLYPEKVQEWVTSAVKENNFEKLDPRLCDDENPIYVAQNPMVKAMWGSWGLGTFKAPEGVVRWKCNIGDTLKRHLDYQSCTKVCKGTCSNE